MSPPSLHYILCLGAVLVLFYLSGSMLILETRVHIQVLCFRIGNPTLSFTGAAPLTKIFPMIFLEQPNAAEDGCNSSVA